VRGKGDQVASVYSSIYRSVWVDMPPKRWVYLAHQMETYLW